MRSLRECRLYAFIDTSYPREGSPAELARQLCAGGADLIQIRAKDLARDEILRMTEALLPITDQAGALLVVNDHPEVALEAGAAFCHLGQEDFFEAGKKHRSELIPAGSRLGLGLSTHSPDQAERAVAAGADYIGVGPVYATGTKPGVKPVTLEYVAWASRNVSIPWFAIGGITLDNLEAVLSAGARRICAVSAILNAPSVTKACQRFKERLDSLALSP